MKITNFKKVATSTEVHSVYLNHLKCPWRNHFLPYKILIFTRILLPCGRNTSPLLATPLNEIKVPQNHAHSNLFINNSLYNMSRKNE